MVKKVRTPVHYLFDVSGKDLITGLIYYVKRKIPVIHLDSTIGVNFLSILEPSDLRCWNSFSMAHKAGGASTWTGQALWPLHQRGWRFGRTTSVLNLDIQYIHTYMTLLNKELSVHNPTKH